MGAQHENLKAEVAELASLKNEIQEGVVTIKNAFKSYENTVKSVKQSSSALASIVSDMAGDLAKWREEVSKATARIASIDSELAHKIDEKDALKITREELSQHRDTCPTRQPDARDGHAWSVVAKALKEHKAEYHGKKADFVQALKTTALIATGIGTGAGVVWAMIGG